MSLKERINLGAVSQTRKRVRRKVLTDKQCQTASGQKTDKSNTSPSRRLHRAWKDQHQSLSICLG